MDGVRLRVSGMTDFIAEYFVNPILYQDKYAPYNLYNTLAYAILAIAVVYLLFKFFKKKGIVIDENFFKAVIPFVAFGALLRIAEDAHSLPRVVEIGGVELFPFVTPGIYILTFLLLAVTMFVSRKMHSTKPEFYSTIRKSGLVLALIAFLVALPTILKLANPIHFIAIFVLALGVWFAFKKIWVKRGFKPSFPEQAVVFSQALDGSATFIGVQFLGYSEQHVLGNAIFMMFGGPWAFLVVKIIFAFAVVELVRREKIGENEKNYLLLLITVLGLGPGLRDSLRMLAGV